MGDPTIRFRDISETIHAARKDMLQVQFLDEIFKPLQPSLLEYGYIKGQPPTLRNFVNVAYEHTRVKKGDRVNVISAYQKHKIILGRALAVVAPLLREHNIRIRIIPPWGNDWVDYDEAEDSPFGRSVKNVPDYALFVTDSYFGVRTLLALMLGKRKYDHLRMKTYSGHCHKERLQGGVMDNWVDWAMWPQWHNEMADSITNYLNTLHEAVKFPKRTLSLADARRFVLDTFSNKHIDKRSNRHFKRHNRPVMVVGDPSVDVALAHGAYPVAADGEDGEDDECWSDEFEHCQCRCSYDATECTCGATCSCEGCHAWLGQKANANPGVSRSDIDRRPAERDGGISTFQTYLFNDNDLLMQKEWPRLGGAITRCSSTDTIEGWEVVDCTSSKGT